MNVKFLDKIEAIRVKRQIRIDADGDWDEDLHPRAKNGQFSKVAGSGSGKKAADVKKEYDKILKEWNDALEKKTELQKKLNNASSKKEVDECLSKLGDAEKLFQENEKRLIEQSKKMTAAGYIWNEKTGDYDDPSKPKKKTGEKKSEKKTEKKAETPPEDNIPEKKVEKKPEIKESKPFDKSAYQSGKKESAFSSSYPSEVDKVVRPEAERVWNGLSREEQKSAILYTLYARGRFNDPQREAAKKGDFSAQGEECEMLTRVVDQSSYDFDMMLQRGNTISGSAKFFGVPEDVLTKGGSRELSEALIGLEPVEYGWTSTGAAKGHGSTPKDHKNYVVQYNIFAPAGTKMLYCEPFSWYNNENKDAQVSRDWWDYNWWDGKSEQKNGFSREFEMLIQRNTRYRITGARREKGVIWIDMEVIGQMEE